MKPTREKPNKRRDMMRWRTSRLRRLDVGVDAGNATERQIDRAGQLANQLHVETAKAFGRTISSFERMGQASSGLMEATRKLGAAVFDAIGFPEPIMKGGARG